MCVTFNDGSLAQGGKDVKICTSYELEPMNHGLTETSDEGYIHTSLHELKARIADQLNPEKGLDIWHCRNCGCMCAGDDSTGMCAGCEKLTPKQRGEEK